MPASPILDVAIGLMLIYILLGLISSAAQETVSNALNLRGKYLRNTLKKLLSDSAGNVGLFDKVYNHVLVGGSPVDPTPAHIAGCNFASAVIDALSPENEAATFAAIEKSVGELPDGKAKQALMVFLRNAEGKVETFHTAIARWYDETVDHLSDLYKRYSHAFAFAVGLILAVGLNVDTVRIAHSLWVDNALRQRIVATASVYGNTALPTENEQQLSVSTHKLLSLGLPVGWQDQAPTPAEVKNTPQTVAISNYFAAQGIGGSALVLLGWLLTALATANGAPFWFDLMQRALKVRNNGAKQLRRSAE